MTHETIGERQARVEEQVKALVSAIGALVEQGNEAQASRNRACRSQEEIRIGITGITHRLVVVEKSVEAIRPTTDELEQVRDRVVFAGALGRTLWSVGKMLLSAAAGATAVWYALTGRPPP